jgi:aspartyl-tRNA(Asn)/glutamyl-tRNA(Gln) amidotransferase subunit B
MRVKEEAHDYRYFPDPDLLPVVVSDELITKIKHTMPELPDAKILRYVDKLGLSKYDAEVIVEDELVARYFEEASKIGNTKIVANWITSELFGYLNKASMSLTECKISPSMLGGMVKLIEDDVISGKIAKTVFEIMFETGEDPKQIIEEHGLVQVSDANALASIIDEVIAENLESLEEYKNGKERLFGFFVGQVMKKTGGKANPALVNKLLKEKLV